MSQDNPLALTNRFYKPKASAHRSNITQTNSLFNDMPSKEKAKMQADYKREVQADMVAKGASQPRQNAGSRLNIQGPQQIPRF